MTHVEFPKWLHFEGEPSVLVQNASEEAAVLDDRATAEAPKAPKAGKGKGAAEKVFELSPGDDPDAPGAAEPDAA